MIVNKIVELSYAEDTQLGEPGENIASDFADNDIRKIWYRRSLLDSSLFAVDENGEVVIHAVYDPWGRALSETNPDVNFAGLDNITNYTGYTWDETLGLYFAQNRFYDASEHRFTQEDMAQDGRNWYVYVDNSPAVLVDPTGEWAIGDSQYSYKVQMQLLALTYAYYNTTSESTKQMVAKKSADLRSQPKMNEPLPFAKVLDNTLAIKKELSSTDLNSVLSKYRISFTMDPALISSYKMHVGLSNENLIDVYDPNGNVYSGGNQAWLDKWFQQQSGCGPISVINLVAFYAKKYNKPLVCWDPQGLPQSEYLKLYYTYFYGAEGETYEDTWAADKYDGPIISYLQLRMQA